MRSSVARDARSLRCFRRLIDRAGGGFHLRITSACTTFEDQPLQFGSDTTTTPTADARFVISLGQKALAIAVVAGISLVFVAISLALGSGFLLFVAVGFLALAAVFVARLLRL